jgi:hypothetical protein
MKLSIKTTFDFGKLANKIENIVGNTITTLAKQYETTSLSNITNRLGRNGQKLKENAPSTKLKKEHDKVLIDKGWLFQSIRAKKDTLSMNGYGWMNHKGIKRPERPFIGYSQGHPEYDKNSKALMKAISSKIGKALKK